MTDTTIAASMVRSRGFTLWGLACLIIAVIGFWPSYIAPTIAGTYIDAAAMMPWHVLSTALYLVLIVSQPALVQSDRVDIHRVFGFLGALVAIVVVFTGVVVQIEVMGHTPRAETQATQLLSLFSGWSPC